MDSDNIYTLMGNDWSAQPYNRIHGRTVFWTYPQVDVPPYPGQNTFGDGPGRQCTTDSLIYP
jgi:hypothetical protein